MKVQHEQDSMVLSAGLKDGCVAESLLSTVQRGKYHRDENNRGNLTGRKSLRSVQCNASIGIDVLLSIFKERGIGVDG